MAVTDTFENISAQFLILEPEIIGQTPEPLMREYVEFATDIVNRDIDTPLQNQAVVYLALHYIIAERGRVKPTDPGEVEQDERTYLSEKTVGDITLRYGAFESAEAMTSGTVSKTKYYEMYLMLRGDDLESKKGEKKREPIEYDGWG